MKLGLDIDGVTAEFQKGWAAHYERWFGRKIPAPNLKVWDALVSQTHFDEVEHFWAWVHAVPGFWLELDPVPGAFGGIYRLLTEQDNEIHFITSRPTTARQQTREWVRRHWPATQPLPEIHHAESKLKGQIDVQVYLDDNPAVLNALASKPCVVRYERPWNEPVEGVHSVGNWDEFVDFVAHLNNGGGR